MSRRPDGPTVQLDDLFVAAEPPRRSRLPAPWLIWAGLQGIAASLIIYALLFVTDNALSYPVVLAVCLGGALLRHAVRLVAEPRGLQATDLVRPVQIRRRLSAEDWYEGGDGMVEAVRRWDRHLSWGSVGGERFSHTVGKQLGELVDERLRQRYGITRATDPHRARQLVGERVWRLLEPVPSAPTPRDIQAAVADLERLASIDEATHIPDQRGGA
jgi:hypothetical protein